MANIGDYIRQKAREATRALMLMYQSTTSGQPPSVTMGHVNSESTQATLPDGTVVDVVTRGPYKEYTQVYNTNGEVSLVDNPETVNMSADSQGQLGYVLHFNTSTKILYVRKFASNNTVYTIDLSSYGLNFTSNGLSDSTLISFSPDGKHICVATQRNIPAPSQVNVSLPGYIQNFTDSYYGSDFLPNAPPARTRYYGISSYLEYTTDLKYVILKNFKLAVVDSVATITAEEILSGSLDLNTPYAASVPAPPSNSQTGIDIQYSVTMSSSDTVEVLGIDGPPLYNNGVFIKQTTTTVDTSFISSTAATNLLNSVAEQGYTRVRGCWSFTTEGDEPLLEFFAFMDSVKYSYNLFVPKTYSYVCSSSLGAKIYPSATLDGCGAFSGYATEVRSAGSYLTYDSVLNPNYWNNGTTKNLKPSGLTYPSTLRFAGSQTMTSNRDEWSGVLTRPGTEFCAPTFVISSCFPYTNSFEYALIPNPNAPGTFENCGIGAWPAGINLPFNVGTGVNDRVEPYQISGQGTPYGPGPPIPLPWSSMYGAVMNRYGAGAEYIYWSDGSIFANTPGFCFTAIDNGCAGNVCQRDYPETATYPQTYEGTINATFWSTRCAIRDNSTVKINHRGEYSRLSNSGNVETQSLVNENTSFTLSPSQLTGDPFYRDIATRHGVTGTSLVKGVRINKNLVMDPGSGVRVGSYYSIFKNANNQNFSALIGEGIDLETLRVPSLDAFYRITSYPRETYNPDAITGIFPSVPSFLSWITEGESSTSSSLPPTNPVLSTSFSRSNPVFTDKLYYNSAPSWLPGTFYRALDSYTFANYTTILGKRAIQRVTYNQETGVGEVDNTVLDRNSVIIPGTLYDIWIQYPSLEGA